MQWIALRYFRKIQLKHTPRHFPPRKNKGNDTTAGGEKIPSDSFSPPNYTYSITESKVSGSIERASIYFEKLRPARVITTLSHK